MLGSIYIGMSGLSAFSKGLQAISNNVANLNTPGFKATTVTFSDVINYGGLGSSFIGGGSQRGGTGVRYDGGRIDFRQGDLRQSTRDLDLAIEGNGFFILQDSGKNYYARTGQFDRDEQGFIVEANSGYRLMILNSAGQPVPVNVDSNRISAPVATSRIAFSDTLSSSGTEANVSGIVVYDSRGVRHTWQMRMTPVAATPGEWDVKITDQNQVTVREFKIKTSGSSIDPTTSRITINTTPAGAEPMMVELDFTAVQYYSGPASSIRVTSSDGQGVGTLVGVSVDGNGQVKLAYSNDKTELLGSVALADFRDPQKLQAAGGGIFEYRDGGNVNIFASGSDGAGRVLSRQIEASNVDLSQQFGDLILIQRGFQASSQVVSVSNDMIQQLFGIRGQG